jgi:hypothetical protein
MASAFSRTFRSEGFSYDRRCFISRKVPSRCIFLFKNAQSLINVVIAHQNLHQIFASLLSFAYGIDSLLVDCAWLFYARNPLWGLFGVLAINIT